MADLDMAIYYPLPLLTTEGYVSLTNTMAEVAPKSPPQHIELSKQALLGVLAVVKAGLVARIDEDLSTRLERAFDVFLDRVWVEVRGRLEFHTVYSFEGTAKFTEEDRQELDFDHRVDQARLARKMYDRIFADGIEFLRAQYPQQAASMAARLDWITSKGHAEAFAEIVGPDLASLLEISQRRYEAMVNERSARAGKSVADLRDLRDRLRRQLYAYCGAIGTLYDPNKPETAEIVEAALRPILIARAQTRRKGLAGDVEAVMSNDVDALLDDEPAPVDEFEDDFAEPVEGEDGDEDEGEDELAEG